MVSTLSECGSADGRNASRTSIYLAAALYCDGVSTPVKIRNISESGALVEGGGMPATGALVQLIRGELIAHGLVAWSTEHRCGLRFSGRVDVQRWRAGHKNVEQQRVDEIVRLVKAGAVPLPVSALAATTECEETSGLGGFVARDLHRVSELLEKLGGALAADAEIVARHGPILQNLDIAMQVVTAVQTVIRGQSDLSSIQLSGLRRSADQALGHSV